ncbi:MULTISPECIES: STAS domain-containing protein [unclassified Streptomyces]|uniref:STAS domain-containing protein n=1 Tax=unclassified Streptomyces TaxID=2593676 RepID=UPI00202FEC4F|nr:MULTISPECIES: STAS domain-containing protein [unclassified Streptomyces]MCM1976702.1 STAS domain-containing protein [Streptomyces sp. G1]MCX5128678.1 STAS domain-containing protein [Streptomyces sp. NBC_00347]
MTGAGDGYGQNVVGDGYPAGAGWVVVAQGELDQDTLIPLEEALTEAAGLHPLVILDAGAITFGDSSFLNLLLRLHHLTTLRIAAPGEQLRRLFAVTGADTVLSLHESVEAAAAA